jgi:hypothetical protein
MKNEIFALAAFLFTVTFAFAQNVAINSTGNPPDNSAMLDIDASNKGLLIPRVALTSATDITTISSPATSLMVYNTGTGGLTPAGYYFWDGSKWVKFLITGTPSDAWLTTGNAGTTPANNFLGTTDNQDLVFRTNNTEKMRITSGGNVGIGTTSPSNKLTVVGIPNQRATIIGDAGFGTTYAGLSVQGTLSPFNYSLLGDGTNLFINRPNGGVMFFRINNADQMVLTNAGNVGIGTTSPSGRLTVVGIPNQLATVIGDAGHGTSYAGLSVQGTLSPFNYSLLGDGTNLFINRPNNGWILFRINNADQMVLTNAGNVGIGTITPLGQFELSLDQGRKPTTNTWTIVSDERLKDIHGPYTKGLNEILKLNAITYNYKNVGERTFEPEVLKTTGIGFSAQEVQKVFPEAVGVDPDGYLNFNMHAILVAYLNAIKEQQAIIEYQKREIELLKQNSTELKAEIDFIKSQLNVDKQSSNR